jgi:hypothetical protein
VLSTKSIRRGLNPSEPNVIGVIVTTLGIDIGETFINDGILGASAKVITDGIPDGGSNVITLGTLIGPSGPILIEGNTTGGKLIVTGTGVKSGNIISGKFGISGNSTGATPCANGTTRFKEFTFLFSEHVKTSVEFGVNIVRTGFISKLGGYV